MSTNMRIITIALATTATCNPFSENESYAMVAVPNGQGADAAREIAVRALIDEQGLDCWDREDVCEAASDVFGWGREPTGATAGAVIKQLADKTFIALPVASVMEAIANNEAKEVRAGVLRDIVSTVKILDVTVTVPNDGVIAYRDTWSGTYRGGIANVECTKKVAALVGFSINQKDKEQPLNTVNYSYLVSAVQAKLDALGWPCVLKTGVLSDMRLLPYARNSYSWEIVPSYSGGQNVLIVRVYKIGKVA